MNPPNDPRPCRAGSKTRQLLLSVAKLLRDQEQKKALIGGALIAEWRFLGAMSPG